MQQLEKLEFGFSKRLKLSKIVIKFMKQILLANSDEKMSL